MNLEQVGFNMHDALGKYLSRELPLLKTQLGLDGRDSTLLLKVEWELTVFITFCLVQACAKEIDDDVKRREVLTAFFKKAAGETNIREFLAAMQPRFDEYEQALFSIEPKQVAFEAAGMLYDRIFPGEPTSGDRMKLLSELFPKMDDGCKTILSKAGLG